MPIPKQLAFEQGEYESRLERVQRAMANRGLDAMLLFGPHNILYLSGMDTENFVDYECLVVPEEGDPTLVILDVERARYENSSWLPSVETYHSSDDPVAVTRAAMKTRVGKIGVERRASALSVDLFEKLAASLPQADLVDAFGIVEQLRLVKSPAEIAYMRRAAELSELGTAAGVNAMRIGAADFEIAAEVTGEMYREGGDTVCWGPIVAAGYRAGSTHSTFNGYRLKQGDTVFFEVTGEMRRYTAPLMRTAVLGRPSKEIQLLAAAVEQAVEAVLQTARAGVKASDVAKAGLAKLEPVLDGMVFHYCFGYPVGIGYPPSWIEQLDYFIVAENDRPLQAGMTFHLPMSVRKYGEYAVNLSQTILVGEDRSEPLAKTPARLQLVDAG